MERDGISCPRSDTHRYPTLVATVSKRCTIDGPIILQEKNTFLSCLCFSMLGDTVSVISVQHASIEQNDLKARRYDVQMVLM